MEDISKLLEENNEKTSQKEQDQVKQTKPLICYRKAQSFEQNACLPAKFSNFTTNQIISILFHFNDK